MPIVNNTVNAVAMTILPDAPVDPVTGLKVPTIAVATGGGISVIKHNGTVVNSSSTLQYNAVLFADKQYLCSAYQQYVYLTPRSVWEQSGFTISSGGYYDSSFQSPLSILSATGSTTVRRFARGDSQFIVQRDKGAQILKRHNTTTKATAAEITNTHNTGHLVGDIRRCFLADIGSGSVTGPELVTNGDFSNETTGWTAGSATMAVVGGRLQITNTGTVFGKAYQSFATTIGGSYRLSFSAGPVTASAAAVYASVDTTSSGSIGVISSITTYGNREFIFRATTTTTYVLLINTNTNNGIGEYDNISVREVIPDRSYKAQSANIVGTLTKTAAAVNAQMAAYSGFSAANYAREPYSADLDFGTGEWTASAWVNVLVGNFPVVGGELLTGTFTNGSPGFDTFSPSGTTEFTGTTTTAKSARCYIGNLSAFVGKIITISGTVSSSGISAVSMNFSSAGSQSSGLTSGWVITANGNFTTTVYVPVNASNLLILGTSTGVSTMTLSNLSVKELAPALIADRAFSTGPKISLGVSALGNLTATAFDGTTTRTVTTSAAYNTGTWNKARVNYTTDGTLALLVNGVEVAATRGNPLLSLSSRYNLLNYSEQFDNGAWTKGTNVTVIPNSATDPLGGSTADKISVSSSLDSSATRISQAVNVGGDLVFSVWLRAATAQTVRLKIFGTTGTVVISSLDVSVTSSWTRFSITGVGAVPNSTVTIGPAISVLTDIEVWGAQVEVGSTAKTYQHTTTVAETEVAPLTIGNSYALDAPFPGSLALLKFSATVPTTEQSVWMYEQEKQLFREGAQCVLPDSGNILDLTYDDATDKWIAVSATNESEWSGLVRTSTATPSAGSFSKTVAKSGVQLLARTTTNPGVDVMIPAYGLRSELVRRAEAAALLNAQLATFDFVGGFTATTVAGNTAITSVAGLTYPTSYIGAVVTGSGIPANTVIVAVSGTTIYLSAAATASASGVQVSFTDFILPVGYEASTVAAAGTRRREGSTADFVRRFDGFKETIRFAVAPGHTAWVSIQAARSA
jgi:hypothetical protein